MALGYAEVAAQFATAGNYASQASRYASNFVADLAEMANDLSPPQLQPAVEPPTPLANPPTGSTRSPGTITMNYVVTPNDSLTVPDTSVVLPATPTFLGSEDIDIPVSVFPTAPVIPESTFDLDVIATPVLANIGVINIVDVLEPLEISLQYPTAPGAFTPTTLLVPASYTYTPGATYTSALLAAVKASIQARLDQSTGIAPAVEQAIWDRARSRETKTALGNQADVLRTAESRGFALPSGTAAAQLREAQRDYYGKVSELSRDIAIKQAELEQANAKHAIEQAITLEGRLIEYANQIEQRAFEASKVLAETAIAIYNAQINEVQALVAVYNVNATIFRAQIELQTARIGEYQARVSAYGTKVQANSVKIEQYRLRIQANESLVNLYKAQLDGQKTLVEIEQAKVQMFNARIQGYVAQINGEVAKLEIPKVQAQINSTEADIYRTRVQAYATQAGVLNDTAKNKIAIYEGQVRALTAQYQGYAARVAAETSRVQGQVAINAALTEVDKINIEKDIAVYRGQVEYYRAAISAYEAKSRNSTERSKLEVEKYFTARTFAQEAAKVGAQVNAQLAASSLSTIQASADIGTRQNVNFQFSGETAGTAMPA